MAKWRKLGLVFHPQGRLPWAQNYAMLPTALTLPDGTIRLFVACADAETVSRVTWIDIDPKEPTKVIRSADQPVLDIGAAGCFDDNGVNPCSLIKLAPDLYRLYYVGYQLQKRIPYTLFTGIAEATSPDGPFIRRQPTPVLERTPDELFFRTAPCVVRDADRWRMWYIGGGGWVDVDGKAQPVYSVRHVTSKDGLNWSEPSIECLAPNLTTEIGFGRPFVRRLGEGYEMYLSIRGRQGYSAGYAISKDGLNWTRKDEELGGFTMSHIGWDSEMVCYMTVVDTMFNSLLFYNGNRFGKTGVGVAIREA